MQNQNQNQNPFRPENFLRYWRSLTAAEKKQLAADIGTVPAYLSQIAHGSRNPGKYFLRALEDATGLTREQMFPARSSQG